MLLLRLGLAHSSLATAQQLRSYIVIVFSYQISRTERFYLLNMNMFVKVFFVDMQCIEVTSN
jgi:hypothetical protein